jgi:3-isopropylmalate/(R)-2-methylmalate dehydratase large subunit
MGMNAIEKILASHSEQDVVRPGDVVVVTIDTVVSFDHGRTQLQKIHDPDMLVLLHDHVVPAPDLRAANNAKKMREFVEKFNVKNYFPVGQHGISHVLIAERGFALPGTILVNGDSHTCSSGALNALARGMGPSEMTYIICKGKSWVMVGETTKVVLEGKLREGVYPRDVIHYIAGQYGEFAGRNLEWYGPGLSTIDMDGRLTMATISAELSVEFSLFPYDDVLEQYLEGRAQNEFTPCFPDEDAQYEQVITIDLGAIEPQIVMPHFVARNVKPLSAMKGIKIDQCFIGSCANGRLSDFKVAADIVRGRKVSPSLRFIMTPGSQAVMLEATRAGYVADLIEAGVVVTNSTCGACYGGHMGLLADGEVCLTASTRNFKGRMGSAEAEIYMASPATVAASAIAGCVAGPEDLERI